MVGLNAARLGKPTQYLFNNHTKNSWSGKTALPPHQGVSLAAAPYCNDRSSDGLPTSADDGWLRGRWPLARL